MRRHAARHFLAPCLLAPLLALPARAQPSAEAQGALRRSEGLFTLEYQSVRVPGDRPIDFLGAHAYHRLTDSVYAGAGFQAPLVQGAYGGFIAADIGLHLRQRLGGRVLGVAGVALGGGGGGRDVEHSKRLSGSGGLAKAYAGLAYDLGDFTLGGTWTRMKFRGALIDSSQFNLLVERPFSYLSAPFSAAGQRLSTVDEAVAAREVGESMLTLGLDNYAQRAPRGSNRATIRLAELQYAHYFAADSYGFASLGMGYAGLPLYNQLLGGVGQRLRLSPAVTLYAQLGLGSGGYAPDVIDTRAGLLLYPKLAAELTLTREVGLALSAGALVAPTGTSRNLTYGLSLTRHLGAGPGGDASGPATYQGFRLSVLHQTDARLRYRDVPRPAVQMLGLQLDLPLGARVYLPLQASGAYNAYLGYPGYAEMLGGLGLQTLAGPGEHWQAWAQGLVGANVHGRTTKLAAGLRWLMDERLALSAGVGRVQARGSSGGRFEADNLSFGLDYRFSLPSR
ncbi:MAG: hypothetical protein EKK53_14125 [Burkholderiales bacterium]|nr:MAG: hypothetical protein EKK53_14125 [Burkholderiales bacterium]